MFDWLKPKAKQPDRLVRLLADYPPYVPKHIGRTADFGRGGPLLTLEQCRENLLHYKSALPERLEILRPVLAGLDIDMSAAYTQPLEYVTALHTTLLSELPPLYRPEIASSKDREVVDRSGKNIALTFMTDLAMLETDVLLKAKPGCFIGLNLDPEDWEMQSWRRPCLIGLANMQFPRFVQIFHVEDEYFDIYANMDRPSRLASPIVLAKGIFMDVIGGALLERLQLYIVHPDLEQLKRTTWLGEAG